jgi:sugar transferase (PEP-CTERM/EpsH1 system associated)
MSIARGRSASEGLFASRRLAKVVADWARQTRFDAVVAFCSSVVPYLRIPELAGVPALVDLVDVDSQKWLDYASGAGLVRGSLFNLEGRRVRQLEREAARRAGAITLVSEPEAELCRGHCQPTPVMGVPNGVDLDYFGSVEGGATAAASRECVFVGALDYRANIDGLTWFCREVWPTLRQRDPLATLTLVGRNPLPIVKKQAEMPGVSVVGDVPDVRPFLARAAVVVAPLRVARGIQNKVLEAMAARRAVVASSGALEGIELETGRDALRADAPAEWIAAIASLLDDAPRRNRLAEAGRRFVEERHAWDACLGPFEDLLNDITSHGPAAGQAGTDERIVRRACRTTLRPARRSASPGLAENA